MKDVPRRTHAARAAFRRGAAASVWTSGRRRGLGWALAPAFVFAVVFALAFAVALVVAPARASAATIRSGETVDIARDQTITDDLYVFARNATIRGTVQGDVVVFAANADVDGNVQGDVLAGGGTTRVAGTVAGSVRAAGGELTLAARVGKDAVIAGGQLHVTRDASISRDLLEAGGSADVLGRVGGDVHAANGQLVLGGPVGGDVTARVDTLQLRPDANVSGALRYTAPREVQRASSATVAGPVDFQRVQERPRPLLFFFGWLRTLIGTFVLALLLVLVWPSWTARTSSTIRTAPWRSLGTGILLAFGVPLAAVVVFLLGLLVGGWWLGLALLGLYALAIAVTFPMVGLFLGRLLLGAGSERTPGTRLAAAALGLAILLFFVHIPGLGAIIALLTILFGLGAILLATLPHRRNRLIA